MGPVIATMNLTPETSEKIIFWMITAIAGSWLRCCSAREANTPARRTVTPTKSLTPACGRPSQESGYAIWDYRPCHYRKFLITM